MPFSPCVRTSRRLGLFLLSSVPPPPPSLLPPSHLAVFLLSPSVVHSLVVPTSTPAASSALRPGSVHFDERDALHQLYSSATGILLLLLCLVHRVFLLHFPFQRSRPSPRLLQRLGVTSDLMSLEGLRHVQEMTGHGRTEQWWAAREAEICRLQGGAALFYEGLVLSLLLDHRDDPEVWVELAARRWLSCQLATRGLRWDAARALLPLNTRAGMPADVMNSVQRYASSQQQMNASYGSPPAYSHSSSTSATSTQDGRRGPRSAAQRAVALAVSREGRRKGTVRVREEVGEAVVGEEGGTSKAPARTARERRQLEPGHSESLSRRVQAFSASLPACQPGSHPVPPGLRIIVLFPLRLSPASLASPSTFSFLLSSGAAEPCACQFHDRHCQRLHPCPQHCLFQLPLSVLHTHLPFSSCCQIDWSFSRAAAPPLLCPFRCCCLLFLVPTSAQAVDSRPTRLPLGCTPSEPACPALC